MSCGLRRSMRLPSRSSTKTLTKCDQGSTAPSVAQAAAAADHALAARDRDVEPDLVRVGRALGEGVAHLERAHHGLEQVALARLQRRHRRAQRRDAARRRSCPRRLTPKRSTRMTPSLNFSWASIASRAWASVEAVLDEHVRHGGVGRGEQVVVHLALRRCRRARARRSSSEGNERHVAAVAVRLGLRRVVEALHAVARDAARAGTCRSGSGRAATCSR